MLAKTKARKTDIDRLRSWVAAHEVESEAIEKLESTGLSAWTIREMLKGTYQKEPRPSTVKLFCMVTGLHEDDLFPLVTASEEQAS